MAEALVLGPTIIAFVQLADRVIDICKDYIETVRDAPHDLRIILVEISSLKVILQNIQFLYRVDGAIRKAALKNTLDTCIKSVVELERLFPMDESFITQSPFRSSNRERQDFTQILAVLAWPLKVDRAKKSLDEISRHKGTLQRLHFEQLGRELKGLVDLGKGENSRNPQIPQIVVVGDQSAGKSSVLEAIPGVPFPRGMTGCTKYATELRLRRRATDGLRMDIISADPNTGRMDPQSTESRRLFSDNFPPDLPLERLFKKANELLTPEHRFISRNKLVIERSGPKVPTVTLVDLPGLVRYPNHETPLDVANIEAITDKYDPHNHIIVLVSGGYDYFQAIIVGKARLADPLGLRTVRVITKPDIMLRAGLEEEFIDLVLRPDHWCRVPLGWHVVLNPGPSTTNWPSQGDRAAAEKAFFDTKPWDRIPPDRLGTRALAKTLNDRVIIDVHEVNLMQPTKTKVNIRTSPRTTLRPKLTTLAMVRWPQSQLHGTSSIMKRGWKNQASKLYPRI